jgi:hypothetical protein
MSLSLAGWPRSLLNIESVIFGNIKESCAVAKKHVFGSEGMVAGMGCQILACALAISSFFIKTIQINMLSPGQSRVRKTKIVRIVSDFYCSTV